MIDETRHSVLLLISEQQLCETVASFYVRGIRLSRTGALCRDLMLAGF